MKSSSAKTLRHSEEFILALLMGDSLIKGDIHNHKVYFKVDQDKEFVLKLYLDSNLLDYLSIDKISEGTYCLKNSFVLEKILREWSDGNQICAVDPQLLNPNVFLLWICLFAKIQHAEVSIVSHNLTKQVQQTILLIYKEIMKTDSIYLSHNTFKIHSIEDIFIYSIHSHRPSYETVEISRLLNAREIKKINGIIARQTEGEYLNVYC